MLTAYIKAAMRRATYKLIEDAYPIFGEIPDIPGVWANAKTLDACREELEEVLEGWLLLSIQKGHEIPIIDRINLNPKRRRSHQVGKSLAVN
jgi:predicted RNase H-like HicB family nuclease